MNQQDGLCNSEPDLATKRKVAVWVNNLVVLSGIFLGITFGYLGVGSLSERAFGIFFSLDLVCIFTCNLICMLYSKEAWASGISIKKEIHPSWYFASVVLACILFLWSICYTVYLIEYA